MRACRNAAYFEPRSSGRRTPSLCRRLLGRFRGGGVQDPNCAEIAIPRAAGADGRRTAAIWWKTVSRTIISVIAVCVKPQVGVVQELSPRRFVRKNFAAVR